MTVGVTKYVAVVGSGPSFTTSHLEVESRTSTGKRWIALAHSSFSDTKRSSEKQKPFNHKAIRTIIREAEIMNHLSMYSIRYDEGHLSEIADVGDGDGFAWHRELAEIRE